MAGEILAQFNPGDLFRESSMGFELKAQSVLYQTNNGASRGLSIQKLISSQLKEYYNGVYYVPAAIALATGLTFKLIVTDDGTQAADLGTVAQFEITPFNFSTALSVVDFSLAASKGTATTGNVTLGSTTGLPVVLSIPIVTANLASLAAGGIFGMRLRRVGDATADTCPGRVVLLGGAITNT
jgi:hypothetical protein